MLRLLLRGVLRKREKSMTASAAEGKAVVKVEGEKAAAEPDGVVEAVEEGISSRCRPECSSVLLK